MSAPMLCFLPPMPAHRPEPPAPEPSPERAAEVVLLIFIVLNVFFVLAAIVPPLVGPAGKKAGRVEPVQLAACTKTSGMAGGASPGGCRRT